MKVRLLTSHAPDLTRTVSETAQSCSSSRVAMMMPCFESSATHEQSLFQMTYLTRGTCGA